jgi:hypothetical protein
MLQRAWKRCRQVGGDGSGGGGGGEWTLSAAHVARAEQYELDPLRAISTLQPLNPRGLLPYDSGTSSHLL